MKQEDYVSCDIAKLLKECGFDWRTDHFYRKDADNGDQYTLIHSGFDNYNEHWSASDWCSAPLLCHAQKWLREKGIEVYALLTDDDDGYEWSIYDRNVRDNIDSNRGDDYKTYESALSAGIARALELIKKGE